MMPSSIYDYVKSEETNFETDSVQVGENWHWNLRKHVQLIFHLKNGQFFTGTNGDFLRAFKNIMEPILNLAYWTEDIDVKDVTFFIESEEGRALSFLIKKYHDEVYVREHDLDTLFDEITESDVDYGGVIVQPGKDRPEVLPLTTVAFCDQTDMEGGPTGFKYSFAPEKLRSMASVGWGDEQNGATVSIDDLIKLASNEKDADGTLSEKQNKVPGKIIEVYIVRGSLPEAYLHDNEDFDTYCSQLHVVAYYLNKDKKREGVTLYRKKDDEGLLFHTSQAVPGRALGRSAGEALLHPQVFTNLLTIQKNAMLEAASKVVLYTDDETFDTKQNLSDVDNLEIKKVAEGRQIAQIPTVGVNNIQLFEKSIEEWYQHSQLTGSAFDPVLGKEASSGTTFRGQERTVAQGRGIHDRRRGQRAKFIELIYRRLIIPRIVKEISKGRKFLATLTTEELSYVAEQLATNHANSKIKEALFEGKILTEEERTLLKQQFKESLRSPATASSLKRSKASSKTSK
jgi:hypothetical protein